MNVQMKLLTALVAGLLATPIPVVMAAPGQVTNTVNVRSGPSFHNGVIGQLQGGQVVDVTGCEGGWCNVATAGGSGWINARVIPPAATAGAPAATAYAGAAPLPAYGPAVAFAGTPGYYGVHRGYYGVHRGYHPVARAHYGVRRGYHPVARGVAYGGVARAGFHGVGPHQYYIGGPGYYRHGSALSYAR